MEGALTHCFESAMNTQTNFTRKTIMMILAWIDIMKRWHSQNYVNNEQIFIYFCRDPALHNLNAQQRQI